MYRGKFNAKGRGSSRPEDTLPEEELQPVPDPEDIPRDDDTPPAPPAEEELEGPDILPFMQPGGKKSAPAPQPAEQKPAPKKKPVRHGSRTGTLIFYTLYVLFVLFFAAGIFFASRRLDAWLISYQASQPTEKLEQVFNELFADPDWGIIYDQAGIEDTAYEGKDAFIAYMEARVGDNELTCVETSIGLSGDKKYLVRLGSENIASFQLVSNEDPSTGIPLWELGEVEVFFTRNEDVTILIREGQTACVNGVALDDSHIIREDSLQADAYLPPNVYSHRSYTLTLSGLLVEPQVTVLNKSGEALEVTYQAETDHYQTAPVDVRGEIEKDLEKTVLDAVRNYALYRIGKFDMENLSGHFDTASELYSSFAGMEPWMEDVKSHKFTTALTTDYCRYSDTAFSVRVDVTLSATPDEGDAQAFRIHSIFFFEKQRDKWLCIGSTTENVLQPTSSVRMVFMLDDTVLLDGFFDSAASEITVPMLSQPQGKVFTGWYRMDTAADGTVTMTCVLEPGENGTVTIPQGLFLEPMTLYALYEDVTTETEVTE